MAKHSKDQQTRVIHLKDYQQGPPPETGEPLAEVEYEERQAEEDYARKKAQRRLPKAVYQISLVLLAVVVGLSLWVNREYLTWDSLREWARYQLKGPEGGDGYPVPITGANVYEGNFLAHNGGALTLSNTALTLVNGDGKTEMSIRHNLNRPVMKAAGSKYLLYNAGSTGYMVVAGGHTVLEAVSGEDIITGAVAANGRYALGLEGTHGASQLEVYMSDGSLQYEYPFADGYITAIALNYDGSYGAVCTVRSEKGEMVSRLMVFDFSQTDPIAQYETRDNLLLSVSWGENGVIYGVGDAALLSGKSADWQFTEYSYQGRSLTASCFGAGRMLLSISAYEHAGASTLLVFNGAEPYGEANPVRLELPQRIEAISLSGGTAAVLAGGEAVFCDYATGQELGRADAGADAKGLALASERRAYVLGVSEVRAAEIS